MVEKNNNLDIFKEKFANKNGNKFEYICGYVNEHSTISIKCKLCGEVRQAWAGNTVRKTVKLRCDRCAYVERINKFNDKHKDSFKYIEKIEQSHIIQCIKCKNYKQIKGKHIYEDRYIVCGCDKTKRRSKACMSNEYLLKKKGDFITKFNNRYGKWFEYIEEYSDKRIKIKCNKCGEIKNISTLYLFGKDSNICCRNCFNNRKGISDKICTCCGKEFIGFSTQHIICSECKNIKRKSRVATNKRIREARARNNGRIDYSITLQKLIERDQGICKICNKPVDINDYFYDDNGYRISKGNHPSIDHILPLSKGGVHSWDNVQLAHCYCNSLKGNND